MAQSLEVRVTAPGLTGAVRTYTVRATGLPKAVTSCLAPGAARPGAC